MPTKPAVPGAFTGQAALDASAPLAETPRGGADNPFRGEYGGALTKSIGAPSTVALRMGLPEDGQQPPAEQQDPFAGMGPLLEESDATVFKTVDGLVQRQELIALNHLAQDTHWTYVKLGYPWSTLTKQPNRDRYVQTLPYGSAGITIQAVPNKAWDLINKTKEALLADFAQAEAEPGNDSEEAEAACDMANRFLAQDAGEQGTNDAVLFGDRVERALTCATSYLECWTDPTGGGYVPLQIPAHPQAVSPMQPLLGPDGMPTASPILRYVTAVGPDGQPTEESQFTEDATQAAPQWQPKLRASKWQREHIRVYPETATVDTAEKVIILGYCTLAEGKRRWPKVAELDANGLSRLCDWTPTRYLALLPPFQRGRWALTDGRDKEKQGSSDERIFFYYHVFAKASPDHKRGADVVVTGALDNLIIDKKLLAKEVEIPAEPDQQAGADGGVKKEVRCMEIPVVQITPRGDPDEMDPTGKPYIELFAGAVENNAHLAMSFSEALDKNLHLEGYSSSTSPVDGQQREDARASGDLIPLVRPEDKPVWGEKIPLDGSFFNFYKLAQEDIESIGSANKAAKGQDGADEKSGKAIALATQNNNVSLGGMNHAINNAYARWSRIKIERAMCDFTTAQQINYVGDDGIFKQEEWTSIDFALVGKVSIKAGTGGLVPPDQKVQNLAGLAGTGMLTREEATDAARPVFSRKLGLPANPHEQRIERQISAFQKGPPPAPAPEMGPDGQPLPVTDWVTQFQQYQQQKTEYDAMQARATAAQQPAGPQLVGAGAPAAPAGPVQTALLPPKMPWTPFAPMPTDDEPAIAAMRRRRLAKLIDSAKFEGQPPEWQQVAILEYQRMRGIEAAAAQAAAAPAPGQRPNQSEPPAPNQPAGAAA